MRLTQSLLRQHLGRMTKLHWHIQHKRTVLETGTEEILKAKNIQAIDPNELFVTPPPIKDFKVEYLVPKAPPRDNTNPEWKDRPCLTYGDRNALVEGEKQAKILTKSVEIVEGLPQTVNDLITDHGDKVDKLVLRAVQNSCIFDAYQERLPRRKDPARPAWVFPLNYGITALRRSRNLTQKLIQLCDSLSGPQVSFERNLIHDAIVKLPIEKDSKQLQFTLRADMLVTSTSPLKPIARKNDGTDIPLPDIYPLEPTISLKSENIYTLRDSYPVDGKSQWSNPHTIFVHYNPSAVRNIFGTPVLEHQILGRSLIKAFAVAGAYAKQRFGNEIMSLPEPVTVQCVQSDGKTFHFAVFQLNTLDLNGSGGERNIWWSSPRIDLFDKAHYEEGVPVVRNYNPEVFRRIFAFYNNN